MSPARLLVCVVSMLWCYISELNIMSPIGKLIKCLQVKQKKNLVVNLKNENQSEKQKQCQNDVVNSRESNQRRALITGINGQVGSYLAELLLAKGYQVHGMIRRESSINNNTRLTHLLNTTNNNNNRLQIHYGDLTDGNSLIKLIFSIQPHEVYNLAAQSHVKISFEMAELTGNTNALGTLRLLEAIRQFELAMDGQVKVNCCGRIKFYQASTSELYGSAEAPQNESTPFRPRSPYGCAKLYAHSLVINYREAYGLFALNGILFNHESPRRSEQFVTRKISRSVAEIKLQMREYFELGNLDSRRDWGHASDYVEAMWLMLQQDTAKDFVIASGESHSVREFVQLAFSLIGVQIQWSGGGLDEVGVDRSSGKVRVKISREYFRPAEVNHLRGDSSLARRELKWKPKIGFSELVEEMVMADIKLLEKQSTN